ncbi:MAG: LuxR C-terminal-related transcriptional regulator, partial [Actinomycetota bacterium]|nr:LuxR C-terminal-related transcriptional regulator [Actinomycetota bacterium]
MKSDWPLVGRTKEIARLRTSLTERTGGGVVLAGPPGAGKTSLARRSVELAADLGLTPQWVYATRATAGIPLGAFAPTLPTLATAPSPERLLYEAHKALRERPDGTPGLLAVDDAHLLDDVSALLVNQLATAGATLVVLTLRSGQAAPEPIVALWKDAHVERIEVAPLEQSHVEEILTTVLGGPVDMALSYQLWRASGGNPLYIRELFQAAWDKGLFHEEDGSWRLTGELPSSPRLAELVEARLGSLDDEARTGLELVALGEPLRLAHVEGLISFDLLSRLEADGLLRVVAAEGGELVQIGHPMYGEVLRDGVSPLRVRRLHRRLADSLEATGATGATERDQVVRWRLASGAELDPAELIDVARRAVAGFDVEFASRCATAAYGAEPSARAGIVLGRALVLAKDHYGAEALFATVEDLAETDDEIVDGAEARADNLYHWLNKPDTARAVNLRAERRVTSEDARRRLALHRAWLDLFDGRPLAALAVAEECLAQRDTQVELDAAVLGGRACMISGRFTRGMELAGRIAAAQRRLDRRHAPVEPALRLSVEVFILVHSGRLEEAVKKAREAHARAIESGDVNARSWFADLLGQAYLLQGRVATAERWMREAIVAQTTLGVDPRARFASAEIAHAQALRGDAASASATLAGLDRFAGRAWPLFEWGVARARAWTAVAQGDALSARDLLLTAADEQRERQAHPFEAALLHDVVRLGGTTRAVAERLEALCDLVDGDLMAARAAHARAFVAREPSALVDTAARFERMGALLLAAEAGFAAADLARREGAEREASAQARKAHELLARCEGAGIPGLATDAPAPPTLTAREWQIAELAGEGLSSKVIAERLFLSVRTVDNYLGRAFAKLGVTSRTELPGVLAGMPRSSGAQAASSKED